MKTKTIASLVIVVLATVFLSISHLAYSQHVGINELVGVQSKDHDEAKALRDKLGFWSGARSFYGKDNSLTIEIWENEKEKELWLVLNERLDDGASVICDILTYPLNSDISIGLHEVYNKDRKAYSDYLLVQIAKDDTVVKMFDVDSTTKKIIVQHPEPYWGKVQTGWDSY